jgi:hypothetical protein
MGDGSFEAAEYLNDLPNAENMSIWSDKGAVCESFVGECTTGFRANDIAGQSFNYIVVSAGRQSRSLKLSTNVNSYYDFKSAYRTDDYVYQLIIGNRPENTIKIVEGAKLKGIK